MSRPGPARFDRHPPARVLAGAAAALACAIFLGQAAAQEAAFPPEHHPWAGFPVGSWKLVRTVTENLDEHGNVTNVTTTDTRTTLVGVDASSFTLRTEISIEAAGRRLETPAQTLKQGLYGEAPGQMVEAKRTGEARLMIDGRTIACELRQVVIEADGVRRTSTLHYSDKIPPFILRRETTAESAGDEPQRTTVVEVVSLDLPQRIDDELEQAMYIKTTQKLPQGTQVTLEVQVEDVPGWVVSHRASHFDTTGRLVRRSTLELLGFGYPAEAEANKEPNQPPRPRRFQRKATRRQMEMR
jgi:hypothetical protein